MKPNPNFYVQKINQIVKDTEKVGEDMNPNYEENIAELTEERQLEAVEVFKEGTAKYRDFLKTLSGLRAPARVMGAHKKFERSYQNYVDGCEDMIESISNEVDVKAFDAAEQKQDEATDGIASALQKITSLLM
ncbi:MAG: hypothetical protein L0L58_04615 [Tetragenococcus koreensis]|nr:hypothetical protein [Tetragenococcus koreensis]